MTHLYIATPIHHQPEAPFMMALAALTHDLVDAGIGLKVDCPVGESLITRARNKLANKFMGSPSTHLLFLDADINFAPADVIKLVRADKPLIGGIYPKKRINWEAVGAAARAGVPDGELAGHAADFVVNLPVGDVEAVNDCVPVRELGTGFLLIAREVFEAVQAAEPDNWYRSDSLDDIGLRVQNFFDTPVVQESTVEGESWPRLYSEDYSFSHKATRCGYQPFGHLGVKLGHIGSYEFRGDLTRFFVPKDGAA